MASMVVEWNVCEGKRELLELPNCEMVSHGLLLFSTLHHHHHQDASRYCKTAVSDDTSNAIVYCTPMHCTVYMLEYIEIMYVLGMAGDSLAKELSGGRTMEGGFESTRLPPSREVTSIHACNCNAHTTHNAMHRIMFRE